MEIFDIFLIFCLVCTLGLGTLYLVAVVLTALGMSIHRGYKWVQKRGKHT